MYDAIIIGGGPAGLSAVLVPGRARRHVLVCENGQQRNRHSDAMHGYPTRDGIPPKEFLKLARAEIQRVTVKDAKAVDGVFEIVLEDGIRTDAAGSCGSRSTRRPRARRWN